MRTRYVNRRGVTVPLLAISFVTLLAFVAFAVDIGYMCHAKTELQRTADCCALTVAWNMPIQDKAILQGKDMAAKNYGLCSPDLQDEDIEFGYWDRESATFTSPAPDGLIANAAKVTLRRDTIRGNPLRLFFAHFLNHSSTDISASAIAMFDRQMCGPFIGIDFVSVSGNAVTDSYDSSDGKYIAAHAGDKGSVCSDGPVDIFGGTIVNGDATAGKGHPVSITGTAIVTGNLGNRRRPLNLPPVDASSVATANSNESVPLVPEGNGWKSVIDNQGNFLLDGTKSLTLSPGKYYFNDFTIKGQSTLNIQGPVEIYITGNLERSGGAAVNSSTKIPGDLKIFMTGGTASVTSHDDFYGLIYAPETHVTVDGSARYFGAIVGKTLVKTGDASGHYDEALNADLDLLPMRVYLVY